MYDAVRRKSLGAEVTSSITLLDRICRLFLLSQREFLLLALLFALSLPAVTARLYSSDEVQYFSYLRSLWFDRDVSFENEYRYFHDHNIAQSPGFYDTLLVRETAAGRRVNYGTMGCALLWAPFYGVADLWTRATGGVADGYSRPYVRAVTVASAFYGFVAILLSVRFTRLVLGPARVLLPALAIWVGTPLVFYMYVAPPFAHATSAFAVSVFATLWLQVRRRWSARGIFSLGIWAAVVGMVREQDVFLAVGPIVDLGLFLFAAAARMSAGAVVRRALQAAAAGAAGFLLAYSPQLIAYNALNGYPGPAAHVTRKLYWHSPYAAQVLLSPLHGFFFWTPLAVIALAGLVMLALGRVTPVSSAVAIGSSLPPVAADALQGDARRVGLVALVMALSQVYIAGSVASWTVAGAFGQRRFVVLTPVLVLGLAAVWSTVRASRFYAAGLSLAIALCVWWNVALMAQFATGMMDRQRLEPRRNAYNAFVTLPLETPGLIYRYLTNRESFYRPPAQGPK